MDFFSRLISDKTILLTETELDSHPSHYCLKQKLFQEDKKTEKKIRDKNILIS